MSYLDIALKVADNFKIMTPARRDSLQVVIDTTAETTVAEIINIGKWKDSPATRQAEDDAVKIQKDILSGKGKLIDFKEACEKWKKAGTK
jgi:hypothetical protein